MVKKPEIYTDRAALPASTIERDAMHSAFGELYFVEHPTVQKATHDAQELKTFIENSNDKGVWAYYPWRATAVHIPSEETFYRLRTARNRNLITPEEQALYRAGRVGIAGLSVGSAAFLTLAQTGGPKQIKLADPDILEITNLNRIRATLLDIGENKTEIAARAAWELDPFLNLELWDKGLTENTLEQFVGAPRLDVFVDEMDNIALKFSSRAVCKKLRVPVVMATDNGDSAIVDVERFDVEPDRPLFHGRVTFSPEEMQNMTREKFVEMAKQIIDPALVTKRQGDSVAEIGKTLSGVAQLGTAASVAGVAVAYVVRMITTKQTVPSGRYTMGCDGAFTSA